MAHAVLQIDENTQQKVQHYYAADKVTRNAPGVIFAAKAAGTAITLYRSGKLLFQGANAESEAKKWGTVAIAPKKILTSKGDKLPTNFAQLAVLGSDETGTGDYFGPITVAAVYASPKEIAILQELGVKDSKMLTDNFMLEIAPAIRATCVHHVLILRNEKYNATQAKGFSQGKMKGLMHNQALKKVLEKLAPQKPEAILIDQFAERKTYYNYLAGRKDIVSDNVYFATKAEQLHISVAAASILARAAFLREMDALSKNAGVVIPKGANAKVDTVAAQILRHKGEAFLKSITKWHFANTDKAKAIAYKK